MRRVVITGLGIVSSIGNNAEESRPLKAGRSASSSLLTMPSTASAARSMASPRSTLPRMSTSASCASWATARLELYRDGPGHRRFRPRAQPTSRTSAPLIMGSGGPSTKNLFEAHRIVIEKGSPNAWAPSWSPAACPRPIGPPRDAPSRSGHQLLDHLGLLDWRTASAMASSRSSRQAGYRLCRRRRGTRLDPVVFVRRDGCHELEIQRYAADRLARLRRDARRFGDRRRRRCRRARGARACAGPRRRSHAEVTGWRRDLDGFTTWSRPPARRRALDETGASTIGNRGVQYINAHGTSAPAGDVTEVEAPAASSAGRRPEDLSTKSLTGHSLGATGVQEAIYCLLMLRGFDHRPRPTSPRSTPRSRRRDRPDAGSTMPGSTPCCPTASASAVPTPSPCLEPIRRLNGG